MRKTIVFILALLFVACQAPFAKAFTFDADNLRIEGEFSILDKTTDDVVLLNVGTPWGGVKLDTVIDDLSISQYLTSIGYELSEYVTPYALLGISSAEFTQLFRVNGNGILRSDYDDNGAFTWGLGFKGKLADLPQDIKLSYDVRVDAFDSNSNGPMVLKLGCHDIKLPNNSDVDFAEWSLTLMASREFILEDAIVKSVTPYLGFKYTDMDLNLRQTVEVGKTQIQNETNYRGDLFSGIIGANIKVNDHVDVTAGGVLGDEMGFVGKVAYRF